MNLKTLIQATMLESRRTNGKTLLTAAAAKQLLQSNLPPLDQEKHLAIPPVLQVAGTTSFPPRAGWRTRRPQRDQGAQSALRTDHSLPLANVEFLKRWGAPLADAATPAPASGKYCLPNRLLRQFQRAVSQFLFAILNRS